MEYIVLCAAAFFISWLTLFSGFGLSTLLLPLFVLFFSLPMAIALTAIIHFSNNLFKLALWGRAADRSIVMKFGIPALISAFMGAGLLLWLAREKPVLSYPLFGRHLEVTPMKLAVAFLMIIFSLMEILPSLRKISFDGKYAPMGGLLSGFFGGLSGHQGALRSAFLIRFDLTKEAFVGTGVVIACLVDISRLTVYGVGFAAEGVRRNTLLIICVTLCAFFGAWLGSRLIRKVTIHFIQMLVGILLLIIALCLGSGLI